MSDELEATAGRTAEFPIVPMGLFSMAANLEDHGFRSEIANISLWKILNPNTEIKEAIRELDAEVFGIDLHWFTHSYGAIELARLVKEIHGDSKVVLGGYTASFFCREIIGRFGFIDGVAIGTAEESLVEFVKYTNGLINSKDLYNFVVREGGEVVTTSYREQCDIDRYDYVRVHKMREWDKYLRCSPSGYDPARKPSFWVLVGRGCVNNCAYCGGGVEGFRAAGMGSAFRLRSPKRVTEDIEILVERYGVRLVNFSHDPEAFGSEFYAKLFGYLKEKGVEIDAYWDSFSIPRREFIEEALRVFGNIIIGISLESTLDAVRFGVGRNYRIEDLWKAKNYLSDERIALDIYWTVGFPGEREDTAMEMIKVSGDIMREFKNAYVVPPFPVHPRPQCPDGPPSRKIRHKEDLQELLRLLQGNFQPQVGGLGGA